jgi:hypothetical protein
MNLADVLFLDIYRSIRGGWSAGILWRARYMRSLLPHTTLSAEIKEWFAPHLEKMTKAYTEARSTKQSGFDGRTWARDSQHDYSQLMQSEWFDASFYAAQSIYEVDYSDFMETFPAFEEWGDVDGSSTQSEVNKFLGFELELTGDRPTTPPKT